MVLLILLILAVLILIYLRVRMVLPENAQKKYNNAADKLMLWYKACLNALACEGIRYTQGDTPVSFAERAVKAGHADETFVQLTEQVEKVNYAMDGKAKDYMATAREAYRIIYAKMGMKNKAKLCLRLFKKGQGRVDIIP